MSIQILTGCCIEAMSRMEANSVDAIVTDPPYGLRFMSKEWDDMGDGPAQEKWHEQWLVEAHRVLKPGGHIIAFGGSRTFHRLFSAAENMGLEIRDSILWIHGQGFPKSHNIEKALQKMEVPNASEYAGQGTALKPAHEPALLGRKALGSASIAQNVVDYGTASLNIDGCRVGAEILTTHSRGSNTAYPKQVGATSMKDYGRKRRQDIFESSLRAGRYPSNVILGHHNDCTATCVSECPVSILDTQSGTLKSGRLPSDSYSKSDRENDSMFGGAGVFSHKGYEPDSGGASRFFYQAKASRRERELGCSELKEKYSRKRGNHHPTIKPVNLMRQLVRLVVPNGGTVLDPFAGSGTTGVAATLEGFDCILVEKEPEYVEVIQARTNHATNHPEDFVTSKKKSRALRKSKESVDPLEAFRS